MFCSTIAKYLQDNSYIRIFADATHLNAASRAKTINKVKEYMEVPIEEINVVWLKTPLIECYNRNANREGLAFVPKNVIKSMYDSIQEPSKYEGINKTYIIDDKNKEIKILQLGDNDDEFKF